MTWADTSLCFSECFRPDLASASQEAFNVPSLIPGDVLRFVWTPSSVLGPQGQFLGLILLLWMCFLSPSGRRPSRCKTATEISYFFLVEGGVASFSRKRLRFARFRAEALCLMPSGVHAVLGCGALRFGRGRSLRGSRGPDVEGVY